MWIASAVRNDKSRRRKKLVAKAISTGDTSIHRTLSDAQSSNVAKANWPCMRVNSRSDATQIADVFGGCKIAHNRGDGFCAKVARSLVASNVECGDVPASGGLPLPLFIRIGFTGVPASPSPWAAAPPRGPQIRFRHAPGARRRQPTTGTAAVMITLRLDTPINSKALFLAWTTLRYSRGDYSYLSHIASWLPGVPV